MSSHSNNNQNKKEEEHSFHILPHPAVSAFSYSCMNFFGIRVAGTSLSRGDMANLRDGGCHPVPSHAPIDFYASCVSYTILSTLLTD
jgi:hypothetical protein